MGTARRDNAGGDGRVTHAPITRSPGARQTERRGTRATVRRRRSRLIGFGAFDVFTFAHFEAEDRNDTGAVLFALGVHATQAGIHTAGVRLTSD